MHEVLVNRLGGLSLSRKSVVRLTDHPDMTLDVYRGRKTTIQYNQPKDLDPSDKTELDLWDCFGRKKFCLITTEILVQEPKDKKESSLSFNSRVWQPCGSKCPFMLQ